MQYIRQAERSWKSFDLLLDNIKVIKPNADDRKNLLIIAIQNGKWPENYIKK